MDSRIDLKAIRESMGCDNCRHENDGRWDDFCTSCNGDYTPPGNYRPARGTIQEKAYYSEFEKKYLH